MMVAETGDNLEFQEAKTKKDIEKIFDHTTDAFSDTPDFRWTIDALDEEIKEGWKLYSAFADGEIVAAVLFKLEGKSLLTKNTAVKMEFKGSGFSHQIKNFFEQQAKSNKAKEILHYCRIDNFRMYSLNESHGYEKTKNPTWEEEHIVEWRKTL